MDLIDSIIRDNCYASPLYAMENHISIIYFVNKVYAVHTEIMLSYAKKTFVHNLLLIVKLGREIGKRETKPTSNFI